MPILFWILISTVLVSAVSFVGDLLLFLKEELLTRILLILVAFSAGALIGAAFLHLLPEAISEIGSQKEDILKIFGFLLFGFCLFFVLEQFIRWHHHHAVRHPDIMPFSYLILFSDGIHNFFDGLAIAASFATGFPTGIITTLAVVLHEIPQELGDFGILIYSGFKAPKALFFNFLSGLTAVLGGIIGFLLSEKIGGSIIFLLPFAAGNFIYIGASDLVPEIKSGKCDRKSAVCFLAFLLGIILMLSLLKLE
jgi:zinc and cadmium transporter